MSERVTVPPCKVCGEPRTRKTYPPIYQKRDKQVCRRCSNKKNAKEAWTNPAHRDQTLASHRSHEHREKISALKKEMWKNPVSREKLIASLNRPELITMRRAHMKKRWEKAEYRVAMALMSKQEWAKLDLDARDKRIAARSMTDHGRLVVAQNFRAMWRDPEKRAERIASIAQANRIRWRDVDAIRRQSEKLRESWSDPDSRNRRLISMNLWYLPDSIRKALTPVEVSIFSLPEVRKEIISATAAALNLEVPNE